MQFGLTCRAALLAVALFVGATLSAQPPAVSLDPIAAIIDAFASHPIVALGEAHGNEQVHALRLRLVRDPRFAATVNDIVVESGNALYQDVVDRFVRGDAIPHPVLRQVWQNTTAPHTVWDRPIYEEFLRAVREVNRSLPKERQLRVLLGDPPIDWEKVYSAEDIAKVTGDFGRSRHPAEVIRKEVLAKRRRALMIYGGAHLWRQNLTGPTLVDWVEVGGERTVFTVLPHPLANLEAVLPNVSAWRAPSLTLTRGTAIENQVDAVLYLGPQSAMTISRLSSALCADRGYREMRSRRMALVMKDADEVLRKECAEAVAQ